MDSLLLLRDNTQHSPRQSCSSEPEKNFPGIFTVEILLEWMESFKRGKSVLRKLGRTETGYFSRPSQSLQIELWSRGEHLGREISLEEAEYVQLALCGTGTFLKTNHIQKDLNRIAFDRPVMLSQLWPGMLDLYGR